MVDRRTLGAVGAALLLTSAAWYAGTRVESSSSAAARARPPRPSLITATVERRQLTATTITRGAVTPRTATAVQVPASVEGAGVLTAPAPSAGDAIDEGSRVIEVSGRPVLVLQGVVPAYRTMRPGMTGPDIGQLQEALARLGHTPERDGTYGPATKAAVRARYTAAGYEPITSGTPGELEGARQQHRAARAEVDRARRTLDAARSGPSSTELAAADAAVSRAERTRDLAIADRDSEVRQAAAEAEAAETRYQRLQGDPESDPDDVQQAALERDRAVAAVRRAERVGAAAVADATEDLAAARRHRDDLGRPPDVESERSALDSAEAAASDTAAALEAVERTSGPTIPQGEVVFVPSLPAQVERVGPRNDIESGEPGGPGEPLLTLSSGGLRVVAFFGERAATGLEPGDRVALLDESTSSRAEGIVTWIDQASSSSDDGSTGRQVEIVGPEDLPETWSGHNVRVTLTSPVTADEVLAVPLAAVSAGADGEARVELVVREEVTRTIRVETGPSADGYIAIRATRGRIRKGDLVVVGR